MTIGDVDAAAVASPCTSVCRMDERTGWCEGCLRTLDEIAGWSTLDAGGKLRVWDSLALRRAALAQTTTISARPPSDAAPAPAPIAASTSMRPPA